MSVEFRAIRAEKREECPDLRCIAFEADPRSCFERYFYANVYADVDWLPRYTQIAIADGKVVSVVTICKRRVACDDGRHQQRGDAAGLSWARL